MSYNMNVGYGRALIDAVHGIVPTFGRIFIVASSSDAGEERYDRLSEIFKPWAGLVRVYTSLSDAYDATTSNNNDVILLDADSNHVLTSGLAITKNRVHFIGMDGGDRLVQQGAKVWLTTAATTAYVIKNTGVRNSFRNIKFIQASTNALALHVLEEGGEGNLYKNCSFTFEVADNLDLTTASEVIMGGDSDTFINCQFGQDTLLSSATARTIMTIDQVTTSQECKSNIFVDCTWLGSSSDADLQCISMAAAGDILFTNHFIRPSFIALISTTVGAIECTKAVSTANGNTKGMILITYPTVHGFADIGINGTNNDGLLVFSHAPSAANITSAAPTTS